MPVPHAMLTPRAILLSLVVGAATGALIALAADRFSGRGKPALLVDSILGAIGFAGGAIGFAILPVLQNAIQNTTTTRAGGMIIRTTTRNYQEAYQLAFGVAALLAVLYEIFRYLRARRDPKSLASQTK
jgi:MFS family permease